MLTYRTVSNCPTTDISEWPPARILSVAKHNQEKMYSALVENSARFYEFKYTIHTNTVVFNFRATDEDYIFLKLSYGIPGQY